MGLLILLPPSEGKRMDGGSGKFQDIHPELIQDTRNVLDHMGGLTDSARIKFYGVKDNDKANALETMNQLVLDAPCLSAIERYTGVVYQYIDFSSLRPKAKAKKSIYVVSGLFGLISAGTQIPAYKLPTNTWLTRYWYEINTIRLNNVRKRNTVVSLLPQSYAKAVSLDNVIHVDFRVRGGRAAAGHSGKAIKGKFVRFLIESGISTPQDFGDFNEDGYQFDGQNFVQD